MVCSGVGTRFVLEAETPDGLVLGGVGSEWPSVCEGVAEGLVVEGECTRAWVVDRLYGVVVSEFWAEGGQVYCHKGLFETRESA